MKNIKGLLGLGTFIACLGIVVVATYAKQVSQGGEKNLRLSLMDQTCSSSSSSSSSSSGE